MKKFSRLMMALVLTGSLILVGCNNKGYSISPVSGKVTCEGEPISGVRVTFTPKRVGDQHIMGPWSHAITNAQGEYTLKSRYDENGAVVGPHNVSFDYPDVSEDDLAELIDELAEAREEEDNKAEFDRLKKEVESMRSKLKNRPSFSESFSVEYEVVAGDNSAANFEVSKKNKSNNEPGSAESEG